MSGGRAPEGVGIIGLGAIGKMVLEGLEGGLEARATTVLARVRHLSDARASVPAAVAVISSLDELDPDSVELIVECAGHDSVIEHGERALALGKDLMIIATGALADPELRARLREAAEASGARILLPAGAIAGLDGLTALRRGGLSSVRYVSTKPPEAWRGTPAEQLTDLGSLSAPTVVFQGSAGEAARLYPMNANVAATVALAGIGFEDTVVELVADPGSNENAGRIEAEGALGRLELELRGVPMPDSPKTSAITAFSILEAIEDRTRTLVV